MSKRFATVASPSSLHGELYDTFGKIRSDSSCHGGMIIQENQALGVDICPSPIVLDNSDIDDELVTKSPRSKANPSFIPVLAQWHNEHPWHASRAKSANAHLRRRWRDLSASQKFSRSFECLEAYGGQAFTLNFSLHVEGQVRKHSNPIEFIRARITRALRREGIGALQFAFALDVNADGRLHIHGGLLLEDYDPESVKGALRAAGGKKSGSEISRQLAVRDLYAGLGWARYMKKATKEVLPLISGERWFFVCDHLLRSTKSFHDETRPLRKRKFKCSNT